jgi:hypothetical protein
MPCAFSLDHYREILALITASYQPLLFSSSKATAGHGRPRIYLRHDVDHSLRVALGMARLEAELGVPATYFVQLHSDAYAVTSHSQIQLMREIASLGHEIGFHYDTAHYRKLGLDVVAATRNDLDRLSERVGSRVDCISRHDPVDSPRLPQSANLVPFDTASPQFTKDVRYVSDSAMSWRAGCVCGMLAQKIELQLLVHPVWWCCEGASVRDKVLSCARAETESYLGTMSDLAAYYERCLADRASRDARHALEGEDDLDVRR